MANGEWWAVSGMACSSSANETTTPSRSIRYSPHSLLASVADHLAQDAAGRPENVGQTRRQVGERDRRREQRVERGIVQKRQRGGAAAGKVPARTVRRGDVADLARQQAQAAAVKGAA